MVLYFSVSEYLLILLISVYILVVFLRVSSNPVSSVNGLDHQLEVSLFPIKKKIVHITCTICLCAVYCFVLLSF